MEDANCQTSPEDTDSARARIFAWSALSAREVSRLAHGQSEEAFSASFIVRRYLQPVLEGLHYVPDVASKTELRRVAVAFYQEYFRVQTLHKQCLASEMDAVRFVDPSKDWQDEKVVLGMSLPVPLKSVQKWIQRAVQRDGGDAAWWRLELYLPEPRSNDADRDALHFYQGEFWDRTSILREVLSRIAAPSAPSEEERATVWWEAVEAIGGMYKYGCFSLPCAVGVILDALANSGVRLAESRQQLKAELWRNLRQDEAHMHGMWFRVPKEGER